MQSWQAEHSSYIDGQPQPAQYPSMPYSPQDFRVVMDPILGAGTPVGMFGSLAFYNGFECEDARENGMSDNNNFRAVSDSRPGRGMPRAAVITDPTQTDPSYWAPHAPSQFTVSGQQDIEMVDILDRACDPSPPPPPPPASITQREYPPAPPQNQQRRPEPVPFYYQGPARTPDDFLVTVVDEGMLRREQGQEYVDWHEYAVDCDLVYWGSPNFNERLAVDDPWAPRNVDGALTCTEQVPVEATFSGRGGCYPGCSRPTGFPPPLRW